MFSIGPKSLFEFDYYGTRVTMELGDIIFVLSLIYRGKKYFEKMTINQVKKDHRRVKRPSWTLDEKQLYLLSRFPSFAGRHGSIIRPIPQSLPNHSGCLGSYGLLYSPGDFGFVGARDLNNFLGKRKAFTIQDFSPLSLWSRTAAPRSYYPFGNERFAADVFDFSDKFLRCQIGELLVRQSLTTNPQALGFLVDIMTDLKARFKETSDLVDDFLGYPYLNHDPPTTNRETSPESGSLGVVHTSVAVDSDLQP